MNKEIEAKFLRLDLKQIRKKLELCGASQKVEMRLMKRALYDYPDKRLQTQNWGRIRVRDEGDKVTLSYKTGGEGEYSTEREVVVSSFEEMCSLLEEIGLQEYSYQESKRETWDLNDVEVVLDEWPHLSSYIEVEGKTEAEIKKVSRMLDLEWQDAKFGNVDVAYRVDYPKMGADETVGSIRELTFSGEPPSWLSERR